MIYRVEYPSLSGRVTEERFASRASFLDWLKDAAIILPEAIVTVQRKRPDYGYQGIYHGYVNKLDISLV